MKNETSDVTERGQITIPKRLRDRYGIRAGVTVGFKEGDGILIIFKQSSRGAGIHDWVGKGKLPVGQDTDHYLKKIRDGNSSR